VTTMTRTLYYFTRTWWFDSYRVRVPVVTPLAQQSPRRVPVVTPKGTLVTMAAAQ